MWIKFISVAWVIQLIAHYCLWYELDLPVTFLWSLVSLIIVIAIVVIEGIKLYRTKLKEKPIGIITVISIYILAAITPFGPEIGAYITFQRHAQEYNEIVTSVIEGNNKSCQWPKCKIDQGPPIRVAFSWSGLIDNWSGVCYDSSGEISKANHSYNSPVRPLFEGDLVYTFHLSDNWYYCAFT